MTENEAVELLASCKPLAIRLAATIRVGNETLVYKLSRDDLHLIEVFGQVRLDQIVAGPGIFKKLTDTAGLNQVEVSKLEQVWRLVARRSQTP